MRTFLHRLLGVMSSLGLSCVLLLLLALLTWFGTLEQVDSGLYDVQKKYFESFFLVHDTGLFPIPLPGANLVLCVLFVNLLIGGMVRLRNRRKRIGILLTHVGIAFLLFSGFVKLYFSEDGYVSLHEGEEANFFESYVRWEIALTRDLGDGRVEEFVIPQEEFEDARGPRKRVFTAAALPFDLQVAFFMDNSRPLPAEPTTTVAVPVVDGAFLQVRSRRSNAAANDPGVYATVLPAQEGAPQQGILWGDDDTQPWTVTVGETAWAVDLRRERYPMPFTLRLDDFKKEEHPRTNMPSAFSSDVTVDEGGASRPVEISMNEPLRDEGLVLYQSSWGPRDAKPGDPLFSTFSVVRNPADQYPLYATIVLSLGLLLHFVPVLARYVRRESKRSR